MVRERDRASVFRRKDGISETGQTDKISAVRQTDEISEVRKTGRIPAAEETGRIFEAGQTGNLRRRWRFSRKRSGKRLSLVQGRAVAAVLALSLILGGCSYSVGNSDTGGYGGTESGLTGQTGAAESNAGGADGAADSSGNEASSDGAGTGNAEADGTVLSDSASSSGASASDAASSDASSSDSASSDSTDAEAVKGPDVPPDGMRYDVWKGFEYSDETTFSTRSYWGLHLTDNSLPSDRGFQTEPSYLDGTLTITNVKAEPVGGEMKLRSGGYVDITIESEWTATVSFGINYYYSYLWDYLVWQDISPIPGDAYTGTSLLNRSDRDDENAQDNALNVGEGTNSGLVESDVTWNGRIYRLYAGSDSRNASFDGADFDYSGGSTTYTSDLKELEILTFRVPADYDGLILMIPKDISGLKSLGIDDRGNILATKDLYADILTDISGAKHSADECYFVKVSDLVEKFQGQNSSSGNGAGGSAGGDASGSAGGDAAAA